MEDMKAQLRRLSPCPSDSTQRPTTTTTAASQSDDAFEPHDPHTPDKIILPPFDRVPEPHPPTCPAAGT